MLKLNPLPCLQLRQNLGSCRKGFEDHRRKVRRLRIYKRIVCFRWKVHRQKYLKSVGKRPLGLNPLPKNPGVKNQARVLKHIFVCKKPVGLNLLFSHAHRWVKHVFLLDFGLKCSRCRNRVCIWPLPKWIFHIVFIIPWLSGRKPC